MNGEPIIRLTNLAKSYVRNIEDSRQFFDNRSLSWGHISGNFVCLFN